MQVADAAVAGATADAVAVVAVVETAAPAATAKKRVAATGTTPKLGQKSKKLKNGDN